MPCLRVFINVYAEKTVLNTFLKEASAMLAKELRKPERWLSMMNPFISSYVTVSCIANQAILWGGQDVPCAQIYLMSLGGLNGNVNSKISSKMASLLEKYFRIPSDHYYIHFIEAEGSMIGYDGATF